MHQVPAQYIEFQSTSNHRGSDRRNRASPLLGHLRRRRWLQHVQMQGGLHDHIWKRMRAWVHKITFHHQILCDSLTSVKFMSLTKRRMRWDLWVYRRWSGMFLQWRTVSTWGRKVMRRFVWESLDTLLKIWWFLFLPSAPTTTTELPAIGNITGVEFHYSPKIRYNKSLWLVYFCTRGTLNYWQLG
jgi:hypothetical protein